MPRSGTSSRLSWEWIAALLAVAGLNVATCAPEWMAALPGLSRTYTDPRVTLASTAVSIVAPGGAASGMATSFAMLKTCGFEGRPVGLAVAVTSIWNQLVILGVPVVAVAGLVAEGDRNRTVELVGPLAQGTGDVERRGLRPLSRRDDRARPRALVVPHGRHPSPITCPSFCCSWSRFARSGCRVRR
jgi:hypothetical protein